MGKYKCTPFWLSWQIDCKFCEEKRLGKTKRWKDNLLIGALSFAARILSKYWQFKHFVIGAVCLWSASWLLFACCLFLEYFLLASWLSVLHLTCLWPLGSFLKRKQKENLPLVPIILNNVSFIVDFVPCYPLLVLFHLLLSSKILTSTGFDRLF